MEFQRFRKKSVVIQAKKMNKEFTVDTLEGKMTGNAGDYLVIGTKGEKYPVKAEIFDELYYDYHEDELEFEQVLDECKRMYSDKLNDKGMIEVAHQIIELNEYQNIVYSMISEVSMMLEDKDVYRKLMNEFSRKTVVEFKEDIKTS